MDETLIGYADGTWINGGHWYADPFYLYSDYKINHYYELSLYDSYVQPSIISGIQYQQDMFFLYSAIIIDTTPIVDPVPVPEPSSFCLFFIGTIAIVLFNQVLTRKRR